MYKVMIADDEGIVIEALKFIIEKHFGEECIVESAKTGRSVIELAETFRPDIAFMDIQMPGINGIEAMKEIRRGNKNIVFIIVSAFNKFDYAKEAINIDVLEYINKPIEQNKIVDVLTRAMAKVDAEKSRRSNDLATREKLEIVVPFIETSFIYSVLFQEDYKAETENYKRLLSIEEDDGFMMVLECGEPGSGGEFTNQIGSSVRAQNYYNQIRHTIKEFFPVSAVGSMMANKVIVFIPCEKVEKEFEYDKRIALIESCRKLVRQLKKSIDLGFRMGIGEIERLNEIETSYKDALRSLQFAQGSVVHIKDLPIKVTYDQDYPIDTENNMFDRITEGDVNDASLEARRYFDWMVERYGNQPEDMRTDIRLKILELVLWAEKIAYQGGGMAYHFESRHDYLNSVNAMNDYNEMRSWFVEKITETARNVEEKKQEQSVGIIEKAKEFIDKNFSKEISLDDVSKEVNISPYYFSKLFKEESGTNFIDYLTNLRIEKAKKLLGMKQFTMKEICVAVGYSDPNYFSRIFKKHTGVTPTEFREKK